MGTEDRTGWERENRTHFDEIVTNYDRIRWNYPDELFADIALYIGQRKEIDTIEIGAGTGIATRPFLDMGYTVRQVLRDAQEHAKANGTSALTMDEIDEIISEVRREARVRQ